MNNSKKTAAALSLLLTLSLASCSEKKNDRTEPETGVPEVSVTENADTKTDDSEEKSEKAAFQYTEDFFGRLDDDSKVQVELISSKLPELIGDASYIFVSDLDGNGRNELIVTDPGFSVYEVSEDRKNLVRTVEKNEDYPSLYPVTDKLICTDYDGKRHYIFRSVKEESQSAVRENEKEYVYENGTLTEKTLRSRIFEKYKSVYTDYLNGNGESDRNGYSKALSNLLFRSGYTLNQCSIGILTSEDIKDADPESLKQLVAELKGFFRVTEPKGKYQYTDLEGKWVRVGGFSAGNDYFQTSDEEKIDLTINGDSYRLSGALQSDTSDLSFCLGGSTTSSLWYADLTENNIIKDASVWLEEDGRLILEGSALNKDGVTVNVEWIFLREGSPEIPEAVPTDNTEVKEEPAQPSAETQEITDQPVQSEGQ